MALVTFGPGQLYWERFGHNAIIIDDPAGGSRIAYNYGAFDFRERRFLLNFALGHMRYSLDAEPLDEDLSTYVAEGRSVTLQILNLTPTQARQLAAFLAWNAQSQNTEYRYDYFVSNCSTKVRDALDRVLGGIIQRQLNDRPSAHTYRSDAVRLISPYSWFAMAIDLGLGPNADHRLSLWQESFIPSTLSRALRDVVLQDVSGRTVPLVRAEQVVSPGSLPSEPAEAFDSRLPLLLVGLGLAALLLWLTQDRKRPSGTVFTMLALTWWLVCGICGLLLTGLWIFSDHWATWHNENLLLFNPLCPVLATVWWRVPRVAHLLATLIAATALISLIIRTLPGLYQDNLAFIALTIPVHVALAAIAWRKRSVAGGS